MSEVMPCCAAEIEHLLGLGDAADQRAGEIAALEDEREDAGRQRLFGRADLAQRSVALQEHEVGVDVVRRGHRVEDEVEAAGLGRHGVRVLRQHDFVGPERFRVRHLAGRGREQTTRAPSACANFTPMCPRPPSPTMPTFWPGPTFQCFRGE